MKRILTLFLLFTMIVSLAGCSGIVVYEEENAARAWVAERTKGYRRLYSPSATFDLYSDPEGFDIQLDAITYPGENGNYESPLLKIDDDVSNSGQIMETVDGTSEGSLLSLTSQIGFFGRAICDACIFDPYSNSYDQAMQVYQKDDRTFRIFCWIGAEVTDFYPIPRIMTKDMYEKTYKLVEDYTEEKLQESMDEGEAAFNYAAEFADIYKPVTSSDKVENPKGKTFYLLSKGSENLNTYASLFQSLEYSVQELREIFDGLGYRGPQTAYTIVYFDLVVTDTTVNLTLCESDTYRSPALQKLGYNFTYSFCPTLSRYDFMKITRS